MSKIIYPAFLFAIDFLKIHIYCIFNGKIISPVFLK